jgi:hypothetical protein
MKTLGIILIGLGLVMMIITGFNFVTQKNVVDLGPIQVNQKENHPIQWSPIVGGILLVAGVVVMVTSRNKKLT